jgi:hypothetical protein
MGLGSFIWYGGGAGVAVLYSVVVGAVREFWVKTKKYDVKVGEIDQVNEIPDGGVVGPPISIPEPEGIPASSRYLFVYTSASDYFVSPGSINGFIPLPATFSPSSAKAYLIDEVGYDESDLRQEGLNASNWYGIKVRASVYKVWSNETNSWVEPSTPLGSVLTRSSRDPLFYSAVLEPRPVSSIDQVLPPLNTVGVFHYVRLGSSGFCSLLGPLVTRQFGLRYDTSFTPALFFADADYNGPPLTQQRKQWYYTVYDSNGLPLCAIPSGDFTDPSIPDDDPANQPPPLRTNDYEAYTSNNIVLVKGLLETENDEPSVYAQMIYGDASKDGQPLTEKYLRPTIPAALENDWRESLVNYDVSESPFDALPCAESNMLSDEVTLVDGNLYRIDLNQTISGQTLRTRLETSPDTVAATLTTQTATSGETCTLGTATTSTVQVPSPGRGTIEGITYLP